MPLDSALPVWTIRPNWRNGVLERLEWLTGVESSSVGAEQAIAYRLTPRRSFEATFHPTSDVRSYFDLWLHRMGHFEFMLPLWHDAGRLSVSIAAGATTIPVDTINREFVVGGFALLVGDTPHDFDKVEITAISPTALTVVAGGITRTWGQGSKIHPLRRARLAQESQVAALTNRVGEASIVFELNQANDIADVGGWDTSYNGLPVLTTKPNYREQIDMSFVRNSLMLDNDQGLRELSDDADRAFTMQMHSFMFTGRESHWAFRQMLYRLNGMQGAVWLPTYNEDLVLAAARLATDDYIDIRKIGFAYTGGVVSGRKHILLAGTTPVEIEEVRVAAEIAHERLGLTAALGTALPAGTTGNFMDACRLASDTVEITHHTDTDGTGECNLGFRSFLNERVASEPIHYPIATAVERTVACGDIEPPPDPELTCGIEYVVTLPTPLPTMPSDAGAGNLYFSTYIDANSHTGGTYSQVQLEPTTNSGATPYTSYHGLMYPAGINAWRSLTWFELFGNGLRNDEVVARFRYDSATNKLTVQVFAPVGEEVQTRVYGRESEAGGGLLVQSVTQALDFGVPAGLTPFADSGYSTYDYGGGVIIAYREYAYTALIQTPCAGGPGGTWRIDVPFTITVDAPSPLPDCYPPALGTYGFLIFWQLHFIAYTEAGNGGAFNMGGNWSSDGTWNDTVLSATTDGITVTATMTVGDGQITWAVTSSAPDLQITVNSSIDYRLHVDYQSGQCMAPFQASTAVDDQGNPLVFAQNSVSSSGDLYTNHWMIQLNQLENGQP